MKAAFFAALLLRGLCLGGPAALAARCGSPGAIIQQHNNTSNHINDEHDDTKERIETEYEDLKEWVKEDIIKERVIPSLRGMAHQLSVTAVDQIAMLGAFL